MFDRVTAADNLYEASRDMALALGLLVAPTRNSDYPNWCAAIDRAYPEFIASLADYQKARQRNSEAIKWQTMKTTSSDS